MRKIVQTVYCWSGSIVWDRGLVTRSDIQVSKKQKYRKDSVLSRAWPPETARARVSNPVSGGQCHFINFILRKCP